jgi:hypothetical protein
MECGWQVKVHGQKGKVSGGGLRKSVMIIEMSVIVLRWLVG